MTRGRILWVCAGLLAAGCNGDSNQTPATARTTHVHKSATAKSHLTPQELTANMVEAVTLGKSTVPVNLKFDINSRPLVGHAIDVVVAVMPQIEANAAVLTITDSHNLQPEVGSVPIEISDLDPTQVYTQTLTVTPTAEGVQLLNLNVALKHDDIVETRAFSVPIIAAPGDAGPAAAKH